jgi:hypothetical protein
MQTRTLLAAVATAAVAAIVTPSLSHAQDTTAKKTTTSKGEVAMQPSFGSLISAINSSSATNDKVKALTTVNATDVQFVNVADLLQGNDVQALNNALTKNQADIETLRTTLGGSQAFSTLFAADTSASATTSMSMKPAAKDIVAADVSPDGKVVLYYWKKPGSQ